MEKKIVNLALVLFAAIILSVLAFHVKVGVTADAVAVLKTTGMTCPSCARTISSALEKVKGVSSTEVDLDKGLVSVGYETKDVKPETLAENVRNAGYGCTVQEVLSPEQYKKVSGQDISKAAAEKSGCCAGRDKQASAKSGCCGGSKRDCGMNENRMPCNR